MAQEQIIQLSAVNIVLNPHPAGIYERFIKNVFKLKAIEKIHADRHGMISQLYPSKIGDEITGYNGYISTFTKLDPKLPWFNTETIETATDIEMGDVSIPDNMMPNHKKCHFFFDTKRHVFIFDSMSRKGGMPALQMKIFLNRVFSEPSLSARFSSIRLTIINDPNVIKDIVEWDSMKSLFIKATKPNPDYDEEDLEDFSTWLTEQNAEYVEQRLVAESGRTLELNTKVTTIACIAAENGFVEAKGYDEDGNTVIKSTKDKKPLVEKATYDSDGETYWDAFLRFSRGISDTVAERRRNIRNNRENR